MNRDPSTYNERLFSGGLISRVHFSRYFWLSSRIKKLKIPVDRVFELGCYDAKSMNFLPSIPIRYVGYDANWGGGLDMARKNWKEKKTFSFIESTSPDDINTDEKFDIAICMEVCDYFPQPVLEQYFQKLAAVTERYLFVSVSNQTGLMFLVRHLINRDIHKYPVSEIINTTLCRMDNVVHQPFTRRGFNFRSFANTMSKYFRIVEMYPYPIPGVPLRASYGVCMIGMALHND
jgi:hypothetical protein